MPRYAMKVNVIEYSREVEVIADSRAEARQKARQGEWECCSDPTSHKTQVVGSVVQIIESKYKG